MNSEGYEIWGNLERRRPNKRQTTVRTFNVVKNWVDQNDVTESARKVKQPLQAEKIPASHDVSSSALSSEPISSHDVVAIATDNGDDDISPLKTPVRSGSSFETSLPGAASITPIRELKKKAARTLELNEKDNEEEDAVIEEENDEYDIVEHQKKTPQQFGSTPNAGFHSGPKQVDKPSQKRSDKTSKRRPRLVTFQPKNDDPDVDDVEYEAQNLVRLFNADRGRKGSASEVTDLDVILTQVEEIALQMKNEVESSLCKKVIRETFIQFRQIFSNSIDVYKERKYLRSATTKANTKTRKMKQELFKVEAKRKRMEAKRTKLQDQYDELAKETKGKEEAYKFLYEFEDLQEKLRSSPLARTEQGLPETSMSSLLSEASGYLSTHRQLDDINDKLQHWVDKNKQ